MVAVAIESAIESMNGPGPSLTPRVGGKLVDNGGRAGALRQFTL